MGSDFVSGSRGVKAVVKFKSYAAGSPVPALAKNARTGTHSVGYIGEVKSPGHPASPQR